MIAIEVKAVSRA